MEITDSYIQPTPTSNQIVMPKILVVEDDFVNAFVMKKILDHLYDTRYAKSGREVFDLIKEHRFNLILMDIHLGDDSPDGVAILKELRKNEHYLQTKVFAVTSYHEAADKNRFLSEGFTDFFTKPLNKEEIVDAINRYTR